MSNLHLQTGTDVTSLLRWINCLIINAEHLKMQSQADTQSSVMSTRLDGLMYHLQYCTYCLHPIFFSSVSGNTMLLLIQFMKPVLLYWLILLYILYFLLWPYVDLNKMESFFFNQDWVKYGSPSLINYFNYCIVVGPCCRTEGLTLRMIPLYKQINKKYGLTAF